MLTESQRIDCENYVLRKSWRVRRMPRRSRRLVRLCLDLMPSYDIRIISNRRAAKWLRVEMEKEARRLAGNPLLLWFLLRVVLPVLIRLVVEWWLKHRGSEA